MSHGIKHSNVQDTVFCLPSCPSGWAKQSETRSDPFRRSEGNLSGWSAGTIRMCQTNETFECARLCFCSPPGLGVWANRIEKRFNEFEWDIILKQGMSTPNGAKFKIVKFEKVLLCLCKRNDA